MGCFVPGCGSQSSRSRKEDNESEGQYSRISFHSFPIEERVKERWIENIGRPRESVTKHSRVCSLHFLGSCFSITQNKRRRLLPDAIPTLLLNRCDSIKVKDEVEIKTEEQPMACYLDIKKEDVSYKKETFFFPEKLDQSERDKELIAYIMLLEKKLEHVSKTSQQRLHKIKALRQQIRRLKKKN